MSRSVFWTEWTSSIYSRKFVITAVELIGMTLTTYWLLSSRQIMSWVLTVIRISSTRSAGRMLEMPWPTMSFTKRPKCFAALGLHWETTPKLSVNMIPLFELFKMLDSCTFFKVSVWMETARSAAILM